MNESTFDYPSSSRDLETNRKNYYGLYNSREEYNKDLITYLYSINNNYEFTIKDPKMREIEKRILTFNLMKNRKPKDDAIIEKGIDTPVEMKQSEYTKLENYKQPPHKLENKFHSHSQSQFSILSGSGSNSDYLGDTLNTMSENWKKNSIGDKYDLLYEYIDYTDYVDPMNAFGFISMKLSDLRVNFISDVGLLSIRTPTVNANSKYKEEKINYAFNLFFLTYYITLFNQKCIIEYADVYKYHECNSGIVPFYIPPIEAGSGNCRHLSVLGYLYLKDPRLLQNVIYNELISIRDVLNNYNEDNYDSIEWINEKIKFCEDEIENLCPSVLFSLILVILNKNFYNVYNGNDTITYDQLKKEIIFYRLKTEEYNNFYNEIIKKQSVDDDIDDMEIKASKLVLYEMLDQGKTHTTNYVNLKPMTEIPKFKSITHNDEFIHDVPFIIGAKTAYSTGHAMVLRPIGNNMYQLIDSNYTNEDFLTKLNSKECPKSCKLLFRYDHEKGIIVMKFDNNIKKELYNILISFGQFLTTAKEINKFDIKDIFFDEPVNNHTSSDECVCFITIHSILSAYTTEFTKERLIHENMTNSTTSCCKLFVESNPEHHINLFIVQTNEKKKKEIYQYSYNFKIKKFNLRRKNVTKNFLNIIMDNSCINILIIPYKSAFKTYLYINNYRWLDIKNTEWSRLIYPNIINEIELSEPVENKDDKLELDEYIWKLREKQEIDEAIKIVNNELYNSNYEEFIKNLLGDSETQFKGSSLNFGLLNIIQTTTTKYLSIILFIMLIIIVVIVWVVNNVNKHIISRSWL